MAGCTSILYPQVLTFDEYSGIAENVRAKLEEHANKLSDECTVAKALLETNKINAEQVITNLENDVGEKAKMVQSLTEQFAAARSEADGYLTRIHILEQEKDELTNKIEKLEAEAVTLRNERNFAVDERDNLLKIVEAKDIEKNRLYGEIQALQESLQAASAAKCQALVKSQAVESMRLNLEHREKVMASEKPRLLHQVEALNEQVQKLTDEMILLRRDSTVQRLSLESQLQEKIEMLRIADHVTGELKKDKAELENKLEDSLKKLMSVRDEEEKIQKLFDKELAERDKMLQIHKELKDDGDSQRAALQKGLAELRGLLNESVQEMEKLEKEKKSLQDSYEVQLLEKGALIEKLEADLKCANDLLNGIKREKLESAIEDISPAAALLCRRMGSGTSLAQVYTQWAKASEELLLEKAENERLRENIALIVKEVEARAPDVKQLKVDHQEAVNQIQGLCDALEINFQEKSQLLEEQTELKKQRDHYEREFQRREKELNDLSRQICHFVAERENKHSRQITSGGRKTVPATSSEVISEHLVTFSNIQELQENNRKLLGLVRELSEKAEEEEKKEEDDCSELKIILKSREKELAETKEKLERFEKITKRALTQLENYKKTIISFPPKQKEDLSVPVGDGGDASVSAPDSVKLPCDIDLDEMRKLKEKLKETEQSLKESQEEFERYRADRQANDRMLQEQLETTRNQLTELRISSHKMLNQVEYSEERLKIMQANCATFKNQIQGLETKNKAYCATIVKHETTVELLRDDLISANKKLARAETLIENLRHDCSRLRESEARLLREKEVSQSQEQTQSMLMNNLDVIRATLERSEEEQRQRLENRLDQVLKENSGLRRRFQEEQDRFRKGTADLEFEVEKAKKSYEEEKQLGARIKRELDTTKEELAEARKQVEDLNKQVQELKDSSAHLQKSSVLMETEKKMKEMEKEMKHLERELKTAQEHLELEKNHSKEFCNVSEVLESRLNETLANFESYRESSEKRAAKAMETEEELNKKLSALESQLSSLETGTNQTSAQLSSQLQSTQKELQNIQQEYDKAKQELASARVELVKLANSAQAAEEKYAREVTSHSADVEILMREKTEHNALKAQVDELKTAKVIAEEELKSGKESWEEREIMMQTEMKDMQQRLTELTSQNEILLQQIEALGNKLSYLEARGFMPSPNTSFTSVDESLNKSMNVSISEEDIKSTDQLLEIIKYLRHEKHLALNKYDTVRAENLRIKAQLESVQKQLNDARSSLAAERDNKTTEMLTSAKHAEILRKVETLSALTDSNRVLRSERDSLQAEVKEFQSRVENLERELGPLREKNRDLSARVDSMEAENTALRGEAARLRQRVNFLIERSSKTSPEDWRRLQQEREALARQVSADRDALQRKEEENRVLRLEKSRLEEQVNSLTKTVQQQGEESKRQADDLNNIQQRLSKMTQELNDTKNMAIKKNEELAKITEELGAKEALLTEAKNKEMQIRKIAKKYKTQWEELNRISEEDKSKLVHLERTLAVAQSDAISAAHTCEISPEAQEQLREEGRREVEMQIAEAESRHSDRVKELVEQVTTSHEEAESLRKENDSLKISAADKEERAKVLLKQARGKISQLQELNNNYNEKVKTLEARVKSLEQGTEEETVRMSALKSQYENRIARLEKECADLKTEKQQKIETCHQRIALLERQLEKCQGIQLQSASVLPWTSRGDAPFASIRPITLSRTVAVLPVSSLTPGTISGPPTTVLVPPQQQLVHTTASAGSGSAELQSSSPSSSHADLVPVPATSSASSGGTAIRQAAVPPCTREEPPQSAQSVAESTLVIEGEQMITENLSQVASVQPEQQPPPAQQQQPLEHCTVVDQGISQEIEQPGQQSFVQPTQQQPQSRQQQQQLSQTQSLQSPQQQQPQLTQQVPQQQSQPQLQPPAGAPATQQAQAVAMVLPRVDQQAAATAVLSGQPQQVEQAAAAPSSQPSTSSNTVTTSQAGGTTKRPRESDGETGAEDEKTQGKRSRLGGSQQNIVPAASDSALEVEYQVPTSSQRDQDEEIVVSEEEEGIADDGVIEEPDDGHEFEEDVDNTDGYAVGPYRDEPDLASFEEVEGPDIDEENPPDPENNEAEIMDDSDEVPNQSGTGSPARQASVPPRPPVSQQHAEASSSGTTSSSGPMEVGSASAGGVGTSRVASSGIGFSRGPSRSVPPLARQQQQQSQLLLGFEEVGDDSIVPSTPTLFVPRRSDGFGEAVSSPQVPQTRFTFSDTNTPTARGGVSQGPSETIELNQLEEAGTGRSVPTTPPQVSPQESVEVGQSEEGGGEAAMPQSEMQSEASGLQTTVPSITVTEAPEDETTEVIEEMPPPELAEYDETSEQRDSGEQSSEQEEGLELAEESGDGVSSEGEKSQPTEEVEEGREAEASEATEMQEAPRRVTRAANTARRSARGYRGQRGRAGMRPTPIVWNEPGPSMGGQSPRGRACCFRSSVCCYSCRGAMMAVMRGGPNDQMRGNFPRGGPRSRRPRGKPKGNFSSPYQMRF